MNKATGVIASAAIAGAAAYFIARKLKKTPYVDTVEDFDLRRYLGKWYEIARYDYFFEKGLTGVTAEYSFNPDGTVKVLNSGYKHSLDGKFKESVGKAVMPNPEEPGKLKVSFFPLFSADYYILEIDEKYNWALVGGTTDDYLWILSRTPQLEFETLEKILALAEERGYDTSRLLWTGQKGDAREQSNLPGIHANKHFYDDMLKVRKNGHGKSHHKGMKCKSHKGEFKCRPIEIKPIGR